MKLGIHERMTLVTLLPIKGDYSALKTIRRAREMLSFTPEEVKFYEIESVMVNGSPQTKWNPDKAANKIKDCPVDEYTTNFVRNKLAEMNNEDELTEQYMSLYEKFVIAYK